MAPLMLVAALAASAPFAARDRSASRDAPVLELAYGPRAQMSLGTDVLLAEGARSFLWFAALAALENARDRGPLPTELGRLLLELGLAVPLGDPARTFTFTLGAERSRRIGIDDLYALELVPRAGDIAFGGGGQWTGFEIAARFALREELELVLRARERVYLNGWALLVGRRDVSESIAGALAEGLAHAPALEASLEWRAAPGLRPLASLFAEGLVPHDRTARSSGFVRLLAGAALPVARGEVVPFASLDVGAGKGLLVNRNELRLSLGVRVVP